MDTKRIAAALLLAGLGLLVLAGWSAVATGGEQVPGGVGRCAPSLQAFFASDFTDQAYQKKAYDKVAALWKRPPADPKRGAKAVVITTIAKDGKGTPPMLHMKSGSDAWDAAAMQAVKAASPFPPLPASYAQPGVEVHFHFACGG
ncbi:MAG TPA: TonB family protein [Candidatus Polarisedimenticolia bacterium]|nr:TonB family protein [Candidatus Polarisedimenticolia bacterium]